MGARTFYCLTLGSPDPNFSQLEMNKLLRAQGQHEMAINFAKHIYESYKLNGEAADVYSVVVKWLAETPSSKLVIEYTSPTFCLLFF
ncbi:putative non-specific serine/threonine protein kinase [Helianthus annuus]|uniref:Non-specific serine/threonine protein kinase n=1 Tax=Helianthus annuus TaxID=4232 RepID=A0A251VFK5_HELAN|nr:putative non-specific serine/threonine protein kinase [Helianthus annuus]KAJ0889303.1 putative non-specific serine/threonine protein kinase [Helianthus annuus]KAJ0950574.1 putative non-specific serine/threonine protein kinase [Helianthus annuus]